MIADVLHLGTDTLRGPGRSRLRALAATLLLLAALPATAAKGPEVLATIALSDLGYTPVPARFLLAGDPAFTVHFVDNTHLLVTFGAHGLLTRRTEAQPGDSDRNVSALLLELPSGRVITRTTWRLQDHSRYLWPLSHGMFLLRVGSRLEVVSPLAPANKEHPLTPVPLLNAGEHQEIAYVSVSPTGDLLNVESRALLARSAGAAIATTAGPGAVRLNFYRLRYEPRPGGEERLEATAAGRVLTQGLVHVPATAAGYLDAREEARGVWDFDFQPHEGKRLELSSVDSSCPPRADWISGSEFLSFGCMGTDEKKSMTSLNLHGEANWIYSLPGTFAFPSLVTAPAAGRFALSRTVLSGTYLDLDSLSPEQVQAQEVLVMQNSDGRTLMKLRTSPVETAGGNVSLSPDGLAVAAVQAEQIVVYRLPPLTKKDEAALLRAKDDLPAPNHGPITLGGKAVQAEADLPLGPENSTPVPQPATQPGIQPATQPGTSPALSPVTQQAAPVSQEGNVGDVTPQEGRKAPTLYGPDHPKD